MYQLSADVSELIKNDADIIKEFNQCFKKEFNDYKIEESLFFGYNSNTKEIYCYNLEHSLQMQFDVTELGNLHWLQFNNNFLYIQ